MQFNSYLFAVFFLVVLAAHYCPLSWTTRKVLLLLLSYVFYAAWNPPFVVLLWGSTVVDWFVARGMVEARNKKLRRALLWVSLSFNLGMLAFFKYARFLSENFGALLRALGVAWQPAHFSIVLPIGISFYTFMTISYTLDVYRGRAAPARSFLDYALYVTFFPHLVSGPIVRAVELVPQFIAPRRASSAQFGYGLALLTLGLFEKVVVADGLLAPVVEKLFSSTRPAVHVVDAWVGMLAFSGQIFCDFAGYSTAAIGVALCLGFDLPSNFHFPYAAIGFSDFWRRWHISLSSWLRDYLYISLGGNRRSPARTHVNLLLTMLIGGLWHGASWTFVAWGGLHGAFLVGERWVRAAVPPSRIWNAQITRLALGALTFSFVGVAWVFFRATNFEQAFRIVRAMSGFGSRTARQIGKFDALLVLTTVFLLVLSHALFRNTTFEAVVAKTPWWARAAVLFTLLMSLVLMPGTDRAFIYFQF
jgi:alginate O-acetyltransferase complex protein AlgI